MDKSHIIALMDTVRLRRQVPQAKPIPVITINGQQISTAGNLTVISAQVKAGKTAAVGAIQSAMLAADVGNDAADTLGFKAAPSNGKAVIHIDTEQTIYDAWLMVDRSCRRAGLDATPDNYRGFSLSPFGVTLRKSMLEHEMEQASEECGGIHAVTIDGVADLIVDPNDTTSSVELVESLIQLAAKYHCPIIVVLHENPATFNGGGKTRGHLGSNLERKAESNLRIVKKGDVSTIFSNKCRSANLPESEGPKFAWCRESQMHTTVTVNPKESKSNADAQAKEQAQICRKVFGADVVLSYTELRERIEKTLNVRHTAAENRIARWVDLKGLNLLDQTSKGYSIR